MRFNASNEENEFGRVDNCQGHKVATYATCVLSDLLSFNKPLLCHMDGGFVTFMLVSKKSGSFVCSYVFTARKFTGRLHYFFSTESFNISVGDEDVIVPWLRIFLNSFCDILFLLN